MVATSKETCYVVLYITCFIRFYCTFISISTMDPVSRLIATILHIIQADVFTFTRIIIFNEFLAGSLSSADPGS